MKNLLVFVLITMLSTGAFAHSRVDTTTPENGAVLSDAPAEISLSFATEIRLTRVSLIHQDHPGQPLDLGEQKSFAEDFTLPLEDMGPGIYRIEWRGLGSDGHPMQGEFAFTVE